MSFGELYDKITQAYFQRDDVEFESIDIDDHIFFKYLIAVIESAITASEDNMEPLNITVENFLDEEIRTINKIRRVFTDATK